MTKSMNTAQPHIDHWIFPDDQAAEQIYLDLLSKLEHLFQNIQKDFFSIVEFDEYFDEFLAAVDQQSWSLFRVFHDGRCYKPSVVSSCLNTALVCGVFAHLAGWDSTKRAELVRAALLHDVGMLFVPSEILNKEGKLSERERAFIQSHPSVSFELVKKWGESFESTQVALQHHEEWNGGGYPARLKGDQIHPWASLVAVAVNFVARVTQRTYRSSLVGYLAMKQLIKEQNVRFSPETVKSFVRALGLNPPGSILLLSDGSVARVVEISPSQPLRPKVRCLIDQFGNAYRGDKGPLLDLAAAPKLFIARPVNFQDLVLPTTNSSE